MGEYDERKEKKAMPYVQIKIHMDHSDVEFLNDQAEKEGISPKEYIDNYMRLMLGHDHPTVISVETVDEY